MHPAQHIYIINVEGTSLSQYVVDEGSVTSFLEQLKRMGAIIYAHPIPNQW